MGMRFVILALFALVTVGQAQALDLRIGFVNAAIIMEEAPQAEAARTKLRKEFEPREKAIVESQQRLLEMEEELDQHGDTMNDEEREKLERDVLTTRRTVKRAQTDFREDFNLRRTQELAKIHEDIQEAIVSIAEEEGFDLIVSDGVIFASERANITVLILDRLRQRFAKDKER
jgi:outer membrane protein